MQFAIEETPGERTVDTLAPWLQGLEVLPEESWTITGDPGGPFSPKQFTWTLENKGHQSLDWALSWDVDWLEADLADGTLPAEGAREVVINLGSAAEDLDAGRHHATLRFVDLATGHEVTRQVSLQVGQPETLWSWSMDEDPGWTLEGRWEWGEPEGHSAPDGAPDPTTGHTGSRVLGYDLRGAYPYDMDREHAVVGPLDMSEISHATLKYWRWLGVEGAPYDFAMLAISTDGENWESIWGASEEVDDGRWVEQVQDLSAQADGQSQVWLRWTMGRSDRYVEHCGWNLDDVSIEGYQAGSGLSQDTGDTKEEPGKSHRPEDPTHTTNWETRQGWGCANTSLPTGFLASWIGLLGLLLRRREPGPTG